MWAVTRQRQVRGLRPVCGGLPGKRAEAGPEAVRPRPGRGDRFAPGSRMDQGALERGLPGEPGRTWPRRSTAPLQEPPAPPTSRYRVHQAGVSGRYREALELIKKENPFPAVCGRICPRSCESALHPGRSGRAGGGGRDQEIHRGSGAQGRAPVCAGKGPRLRQVHRG